MVFVPVAVLQVVELMMLLDPKFDHFTPGLYGCGLVEFLASWKDLLVNQVVQIPELVQRVR